MTHPIFARYARGLRGRVALLLVGGVMIAWVGFFALLLVATRAWLFDELQNRGRVLAMALAKELVTPVVVADRTRLLNEVTHAALQEDVRGIAVYEAGVARPLMAISAESDLWRELPGWMQQSHGTTTRLERWSTLGQTEVWEIIEPIRRVEVDRASAEGQAQEMFGLGRSSGAAPPPRTVGYVRVVLSTDRMMRAVNGARVAGAIILIFALLFGTGASMGLVRIVVRPLRDAATLAREIAGGRLDRRLPVTNPDELGDLAESLNTMAAALQESRARAHAEAEALRATAHAVVAIARGARASHDPASVFALVAGQLREIIALDGVALAIESETDGPLRITQTDPAKGWGSLRTGEPLDPLLTRVAREAGDTPRRIGCASSTGTTSRAMVAGGIAELVLVPLSVREGRFAVLLLGAREEGRISGAQEEIAAGLASHLSSALLASELSERVEHAFGEVRSTREHLERSERLRMAGEIAAGVAHDFNNLLGAILGRAQILRMRADKGTVSVEDTLKAIGVIERACHDGAETVRRLRRFSQTDGPAEERVDIERVLRDAVEFTRPRWEAEAQATGRSIAVTVDSPVDACVTGRSSELREVFTNVLLNAVDALPHGGVITLQSAVDRSGQVVVTVRDTGTGMSPETLARIFDPFFTTKGASGTGLGLSVAYGIVQRHGGTISVSSEEGRGTCVDVRLPYATGASGADTQHAAHAADDTRASRALRVALVDDEPALRDLLGEMVTGLGHTATVFETGEQVLASWTPGAFDVLLSDLGMPGMSGWQLAAAVRDMDERVIIAFVTGWGDSVTPAQVHDAGADAVIAKPFTLEQIQSALRLATTGREGSQAA